MKKLAILVFIHLFLFGCMDTVIPEESELERYPELKSLLINMNHFEGVRHKIDTGEYIFKFTTSMSKEAYFQELEKYALANDWLIEDKSDNHFKLIKEHPNKNLGFMFVTITYDKGKYIFHHEAR